MSLSPRQETVGTSPLEKVQTPNRFRSRRFRRRRTTLLITGTVLCSTLLLTSFVKFAQQRDVRKPRNASPHIVIPAAVGMLSNSQRTTPATFDFSQAVTNIPAIDPLFAAYYHTHAGATALGAPLTPAYRLPQGDVQFFTSGALLLPANGTSGQTSQEAQQWDTTHFGDLSRLAFADGWRDATSGIVQLPLLYALLLNGSTMALGNVSSGLNYTNLRADISADTLVASPENGRQMMPHSANHQVESGVFVAESAPGTAPLGHMVPEALWDYITRPAIAPDGWQNDIGIPLSEAQPFTMLEQGATHHMEIQVFAHAALLMDQDATDSNGQPTITPLNTGLAYLETLNAPAPLVQATTQIWGTDPWANTPVLPTPGAGTPLFHVGLNVPLTLNGPYQWRQGILWYEVQWSEPHTSGIGWVPASATTITAPDPHSPLWYSFDSLSPDLASYLARWGNHASAAIFDETRNAYYLYNVPRQFYMASSAKVPIMLTFLAQVEQQDREPDDEEMYWLTTMIENSDNDSAQALFDEIGGSPALTAFMKSLDIGYFTANQPIDWGYTTISTLSMVRLLTLLHDGKILTAADRNLALNLMENIESDQQVGVGTASPNGATVAMKDGWVQEPNYLWAMNTSGIVTVGHETYIIAVYTQEEADLTTGWNITQHVCSVAGQALMA